MKIVINTSRGIYAWTSEKAAKRYNEICGKTLPKEKSWKNTNDYNYLAPDRTDPAWIQVVEELKEEASANSSIYSVVEIDENNFSYKIFNNYNGEKICLFPIIDVDKIVGMNIKEIKEYLDFLNIKYKEGE